MKIKAFIKILLVFISFLILSAQSWAVENYNILTKVVVTNQDTDSYTLNLYFNNTFKGKSYLQKDGDGHFSVYIPDTATNKKNIKVSYKLSKNMPKIKVNVSQKPFIKEGRKNAYTKLEIKMDDTYSLRLSAQKYDKTATIKNIVNLIAILLVLVLIRAFFTFKRLCSGQIYQDSYTVIPKNNEYAKKEHDLSEIKKVHEVYIPESKIMPVTNPSKALKTVEKDSFKCFDIPMVKLDRTDDYEIKSSIKQTSVITNKNSKATSPIRRAFVEDPSEFSMPCVNDEDYTIIEKSEKEEETKRTDVISELKLTPTKGLYLRHADDQYILYGAIGTKAYIIRRFNTLNHTTIQARFYDQDSKNDIYIVRLDSYKAMIEISDSGMKELAVL